MSRELDCYPLPSLREVCERLEGLIEDKEDRLYEARIAGDFQEADRLRREIDLHEQALGWLREEDEASAAERAEYTEKVRAELEATMPSATKAAA